MDYFELCHDHLDGLVQERRNSIANALELRLFCTKPSIWSASGYAITDNQRNLDENTSN